MPIMKQWEIGKEMRKKEENIGKKLRIRKGEGWRKREGTYVLYLAVTRLQVKPTLQLFHPLPVWSALFQLV